MKKLGGICFSLLISAVAAILGGLVLAILWEWYIVYTFHVKPLTFIEAIGISFFVSYLINSNPIRKDNLEIKTEDIMDRVISTISYLIAVILTGWILVQFH